MLSSVIPPCWRMSRADARADSDARRLCDPEPLLHQAVGWMLREVGERVDHSELTGFLDAYAAPMPRTMLGSATEHLDPDERARSRAMRRAGGPDVVGRSELLRWARIGR
ncbi:DNA alkylation repair protein [Agromyces lapidis]|uniref:DNA alkylation repair protein n=1 Tax=Agromyces lapidis TaxID=279574 RepID=A0ABV5SKY2_9MICO|nr:DNA alkylation repair protein [Agromyces lapidis]